MSCNTCAEAKRESTNPKFTAHMARHGSAICQAYSRREKRPVLVALFNAAGMFCGGRWYVPVAGQAELI